MPIPKTDGTSKKWGQINLKHSQRRAMAFQISTFSQDKKLRLNTLTMQSQNIRPMTHEAYKYSSGNPLTKATVRKLSGHSTIAL